MGPDGEIIRLSLWDPAVDTEDHPIKGNVTQGHGNRGFTWFYIVLNQINTEHIMSILAFARIGLLKKRGGENALKCPQDVILNDVCY